MKNVVSKLIPLVTKFKGKKKIVIILSVVAIAAVIFAAQKGYISEDAIKFDVIIDQISAAFHDSTEVVDTAVNQIDTTVNVVDNK
jgi:LPS O-antigen subunit length determinant protein (WzzB/FepE family)